MLNRVIDLVFATALRDGSHDAIAAISDEAIGGVIAGLILIALGAIAAWLWKRRREPLEAVAAGQEAVENYLRRLNRAKRSELVDWVLQRADVLKVDVPVNAKGTDPVRVTFHPSGRASDYYSGNHLSYRAGLGASTDPTRVLPGSPPRVVSRWTDDELRAWLREHRDELPPSS